MKLLTPLLDLFFPPRCIFCRGPLDCEQQGVEICQSCYDGLLDPRQCCSRCSHPLLKQERFCPVCHGRFFAFKGACALNVYRGNLKQVVHRYKYKDKRHLAHTLGRLAAGQIKRCNWPNFKAVVPVPLHPLRLAERGYDQAFLLAEVIAADLQLPVQRHLIRTRATISQTKLDSMSRWDNVRDAFAPSSCVALSGNILLVDDLLTTGATAHNAAETLLFAGADSVYLAVVGR